MAISVGHILTCISLNVIAPLVAPTPGMNWIIGNFVWDIKFHWQGADNTFVNALLLQQLDYISLRKILKKVVTSLHDDFNIVVILTLEKFHKNVILFL